MTCGETESASDVQFTVVFLLFVRVRWCVGVEFALTPQHLVLFGRVRRVRTEVCGIRLNYIKFADFM